MTRVACIGYGPWGKNLVRNFNDVGVLACVCEADTRKHAAIHEAVPGAEVLPSLDEVLGREDVDAVAIATPAETHGSMVRRALDGGKDVFVEKPLCLDVSEAEDLARRAEAQGRILMVGHILWYHPAVLRLRDLVEQGGLGRIQYIYSSRLNLGRIRREENILWSFAPHDLSVILGLVGEEPEHVSATGANYLHQRIADVSLTHLSFPSGVHAHVFVSWLHPFKEQKLVVVGERGMAVFDDTVAEGKLVHYAHRIDWEGNVPFARRAEGEVLEHGTEEPLRAECDAFVQAVRTRQPPRTDAWEAIRVLRVLAQAQKSLDGGAKGAAPSGLRAPGDYFAHETAIVDPDVRIGSGTKIWHFSHVMSGSTLGERCRVGQNVVIGPDVTIGANVKIQNNVSVYKGVTLEDDVFCGPSMVFTNVINPRSEVPRMEELRPTLVRRGATLGANCTVVCGVTIEPYAFVGAGAVVLRDVPAHGLVVGNPARLAGWMCRCGHRVDFRDDGRGACRECGEEYVSEDGRVRAVHEHAG